MLLRTRSTHFRPRHPDSTISQVKFHHSVIPVKPKVLLHIDEECDDFLPWLEKKAGAKISSVLSIGKSKHGRSLFASDFIGHGDCILKVPFSVHISPDDILPEMKPLVGKEVGNVARLALLVLVEQRKDKDSPWAPYISRLPQFGEMHSTIYWSESELQMIQPSSVCQRTINHLAQIRKDFLAVKLVMDQFPEIFQNVTFEEFKHAYALVGSRAWGSLKGLSLIPFVDFLNHNGTSASIVLSDEDKQISEVIADQTYAPGEEVLIRYGKFSNSTLLIDFGFTAPYNVYDQVQFNIDIPHHDHLRPMKMEILQRHHLPVIKDANFSSSGCSFLLREVRSSRGKGKGIPQSLRAFARVLCCDSPHELDDLVSQAAQSDGRLARHPLSNWDKEIQAHQILLERIDDLIQEYDASIKSLRRISIRNCSKRRQMAEDLLNGELRVLKSVSSWLKNYCTRCAV